MLKAVPLLAKTTAKAAAARDQQGTRQRIGRERAAVSDLMAACEGLLLELSHMLALQVDLAPRPLPAPQAPQPLVCKRLGTYSRVHTMFIGVPRQLHLCSRCLAADSSICRHVACWHILFSSCGQMCCCKAGRPLHTLP